MGGDGELDPAGNSTLHTTPILFSFLHSSITSLASTLLQSTEPKPSNTLAFDSHFRDMSLPQNLKTFYPLPKAYKKGPYTVEATGVEKVEGETIPRRNVKTKDQLKSRPREDVTTVVDLLKYASATYGNAKAVGYRKLIKMHHENKKVKKMVDGKEQEVDKTWSYFEMGPYNYMSFIEFEKLAVTIGCSLRKLGLETGDKVQLFAATRRVLRTWI
jgi:hypothetical protein